MFLARRAETDILPCMTVAELIEALQALDPDMTVIMPSRIEADFATPGRVILDTMYPSAEDGLQLCDYTDEGCVTVARLFEAGDHDDRASRPKPEVN